MGQDEIKCERIEYASECLDSFPSFISILQKYDLMIVCDMNNHDRQSEVMNAVALCFEHDHHALVRDRE